MSNNRSKMYFRWHFADHFADCKFCFSIFVSQLHFKLILRRHTQNENLTLATSRFSWASLLMPFNSSSSRLCSSNDRSNALSFFGRLRRSYDELVMDGPWMLRRSSPYEVLSPVTFTFTCNSRHFVFFHRGDRFWVNCHCWSEKNEYWGVAMILISIWV